MDVALVTVGDELLAGDTENTNTSWLARQLTAAGATVTGILTVPDDRAVIADAVARYHDAFDAVIVTGGIGGTPDDVTKSAVVQAFDRTFLPPIVSGLLALAAMWLVHLAVPGGVAVLVGTPLGVGLYVTVLAALGVDVRDRLVVRTLVDAYRAKLGRAR